MNITDFLSISVVGIILSGLVEVIKTKYGPTSGTTKLITIGLAVVVGLLYVLLVGTTWWTTILGILAAASTVYAFVLK